MLHRSRAATTGFLLLALLPFSRSGAAQERPLVVIDPGHGGDAVGVEYEGWLEKALVLQIGFAIGAELVDAGFDVMFTRTRDVDVEWAERRRIAEAAGASMLLMLHANGDEDVNRHGAEVYVNLDDSRSSRLAEQVAQALRASGSAVVVEGRDWEFLRSPTVPTAMIELAFMTHPVERRLLQTSAFHHELGRAFASAASSFLSAN